MGLVVLLLLRYAFEFALSYSAIGQAALIGKNSGRVVIALNPNAVQVLVEGPPLPSNSPEGGTNGPAVSGIPTDPQFVFC